jgi:hypothetical protein
MAVKTVTSAQHQVAATERALSTNLTAPAGALALDESMTVLITALTTNAGTTYLGPTGVGTTSGYPLPPGASIAVDASELSAIFSIGTANDRLGLLGLIRG